MIELCHVWGAVGCAVGIVFSTFCFTITILWEDYYKDKKRIEEYKNS